MSSVSRDFVQASAAQLKELCERKLNELELVALLIGGIEIGKQVLVMGLGIEHSGKNHVLGLRQGATENTTVVKSLLEDLVARGVEARQAVSVRDRRGEGLAGGDRDGVRRTRRSATMSNPQEPECEGSFAGELPEGLPPADPQRQRDDQFR